MGAPKIKFTVITATYNAAAVLPRLISSLQAQTDQDFEWVVADGASTDETLALLEEAGRTLNVRVDSRPDFGIYDALNRAVRMAEGDYYLVVGADDELFPDAVLNYRNACSGRHAEMIVAGVYFDDLLRKVPLKSSWLRGQFAYVNGHAVGTAFLREMHQWPGVGFYSREFPIAADQYFILKAIKNGARTQIQDFCAGRHYLGGVSASDVIGTMTEFFRVQLRFESRPLQFLLFLLRLLKNSPKIIRKGRA